MGQEFQKYCPYETRSFTLIKLSIVWVLFGVNRAIDMFVLKERLFDLFCSMKHLKHHFVSKLIVVTFKCPEKLFAICMRNVAVTQFCAMLH
jgi:hypothetical protein